MVMLMERGVGWSGAIMVWIWGVSDLVSYWRDGKLESGLYNASGNVTYGLIVDETADGESEEDGEDVE